MSQQRPVCVLQQVVRTMFLSAASFSFIHPRLSIRQKTTVWAAARRQPTECLYPSAAFSLITAAHRPCKVKMKAAFHPFQQEPRIAESKKHILCLSNVLCDCHQMDVCISVIIYEYSI